MPFIQQRLQLDRLFKSAQARLERLLERVCAIPIDGPLSGLSQRDFDPWVRCSGARLDDILATLRNGLTA